MTTTLSATSPTMALPDSMPQLRCFSKKGTGDLLVGRFGQRLPERLGAFDIAFSKVPMKNGTWHSLSLVLRSGLP